MEEPRRSATEGLLVPSEGGAAEEAQLGPQEGVRAPAEARVEEAPPVQQRAWAKEARLRRPEAR